MHPLTTITIRLSSLGLKRSWIQASNLDSDYYLLPKADFYIDCRLQPDFAQLSQNAVPTARKLLQAYEPLLLQMFRTIPTRHPKNPWSNPIDIICFCAWGQHRSPQFKKALAEHLCWHGGFQEQIKDVTGQNFIEVEVVPHETRAER